MGKRTIKLVVCILLTQVFMGVNGVCADDLANSLSVRPEKMFLSTEQSNNFNHNTEIAVRSKGFSDFEDLINGSKTFNDDTAYSAAVLSQATYSRSNNSDTAEGWTTDDLIKLGYIGIENYNYELPDRSNADKVNSATNIAFTIAHKKLPKNGNAYAGNAFIIILRGTPTSKEWNGDFQFEKGKDVNNPTNFVWEDNIYHLANEVHEQFKGYCMQYTNSESCSGETKIEQKPDNRILVAGHSRGGGTAECLGFMFDNDILKPLGTVFQIGKYFTSQAFKTDELQVYAIAPTQGFYKDEFKKLANKFSGQNLSDYYNIFDIINPYDFVPTTPMSGWGYSHIGKKYEFILNDGNYVSVQNSLINDFRAIKNGGLVKIYEQASISNIFKPFNEVDNLNKQAIIKMLGRMLQISPNESDFNTKVRMLVSYGNTSRYESISLAMYLQQLGNRLAGDKCEDWFDALNKNIQTIPANDFYNLGEYLPIVGKDGPNVAHHLCSNYIAWIDYVKVDSKYKVEFITN
ncbi:MAG: hypothetical protein LBT37_02955 [Lactobacillaceae bacterium]|jgi:hypothetical protein|nr:hypothetical protein [Lactobacillaceae bacterium]